MQRRIPIVLRRLTARFRTSYAKVSKYAAQLLKRLRPVYTRRRIVYATGALLVLIVVAYLGNFYWPRTVQFSYARQNCFTAPILLPNLTVKQKSTHFAVKHLVSLSIGNTPIYSKTTCVELAQPFEAKTSEPLRLTLPGNPLLKKVITVKSEQPPSLKRQTPSTERLSTREPLLFTLSKTDKVFDYHLAVNRQRVACTKEDKKVSCDISKLPLAQATTYEFVVQRSFKAHPVSAAFKEALTTVDPVQITGTSIASGQVLYDMTNKLVATFNKPIGSAADVHVRTAGPNGRDIPVTTSVQDRAVIINLTQPLPRSASLALSIGTVTAVDGSYLSAPFSLPFATSGGPKVRGINIGSNRIHPGRDIILTFDVGLAGGQNLNEFIRIEAGGIVAAAAVSVQGNRVTIRPNGLAPCTPFTVRVLDGLENVYGVSGGSAWRFTSRMLCQTVFSIGTSVQGRSITAYSFGRGPQKIVVVGGTHGDEKSSVHLLNRWIEQLELNPQRIAAQHTIVIIPNLNPDGYATNRRTNAHNVDLNRNFPSDSWKAGVTMPDKSFLPQGGGTSPLSEPESRALANYVSGQRPRLVLTYHAAGGVVAPNGSGDSNIIAVEYGKKSIVGYMGNNQTSTFFEYDTTGAFEDWLHDHVGIPALLIELESRTSNDYSGHQNALWYITGL